MKKMLQYMLRKKVWPFVVAGISVLVFAFAKSWGKPDTEPANRFERILTSVTELLSESHFSPKALDDKFSKEVFAAYLKAMDSDKSFLLKSDVAALKKYETLIDNEMRTGKTQFIYAFDEVWNKRVAVVEGFYKELLAKPFDFTIDEKIQLDSDKRDFFASDAQLKEYWRKRLKYMVLERYAEALEIREKNKDSANFEVKTNEQLEKESRERVEKIWDRNFSRIKRRFTLDEKFNLYVNTIAETMDPHTQFFPPVEKRAFDEVMSGQFFGIGAQLQEQDGVIKIVSLVTGSPAWKSGEVHVNDVILKVAQGSEEPVDIAGFETTDVRLTLRKSDGTIKTVSLIRDKIVQEETFARSAIVQKENKIGYIWLPEFYANFEDPEGARCARDVANEIKKLKAEKVDGIVMDLRFNGGGSLQDVIQMVGLFIEDGPVVMVKNRDGDASVYRDRDKGVLYDGPLMVMINEYSASASEIFAAAIQDYGRGIVVGTQSYGKGTVQRHVGIDPKFGFMMQSNELGSLKLTLQKFYRINGGSTQLKGVQPNIVLPDLYMFSKNREQDNPTALPWDEIPKTTYKKWTDGADIAQLEKEYQSRVNNNTIFNKLKENAKWINDMGELEASLNLAKYQQLQKQIKEKSKENEKLLTLNTPLEVRYMQADLDRIEKMDKEKAERFRTWLKGLSTDIYINETTNILNDIIANGKMARK
jgi:carboxyl-terminal processing protease